MNAFRVVALVFVCACGSILAQQTNVSETTTITIDGVTYSNVTWGTVTPSTVTAFHNTGIAKIPLEKLSAELQKRFRYDPDRAKQYRIREAELDRQQQRQATLQKLRAQNLRKIGNKLYDFSAVVQFLTPGVLDREQATRNARYCAVGNVVFIRGDMVLLDDMRIAGYIYVEHCTEIQKYLENTVVSIPSLYIGNRDGKRVYDCGVVPTDDDLLRLPVERPEIK
jgi:hypothetical protein